MFELTDAQKKLQQHARTVVQKEIVPCAAEVDRSEEHPWANVEVLAEEGKIKHCHHAIRC